MRFLTYALISIILAFAVPYFLAKNKRVYFLGIGTLILGSSLFLYPYFFVPVTLEDYQVSNVNYQEVYFDENIERMIILSEGRKYSFSVSSSRKIDKDFYPKSIETLKLSSQAKIWFIEGRNNYLIVKGIKTENYFFDPSESLSVDNNTKIFTAGGIFFGVGGGILILLAILDSYLGLSEDKNKLKYRY